LIERFHRDEQTITRVTTLARRVLDDQVFTTRPADGAFDHLDEPADTVLIVHDHVPCRQREGIDLIAALGRQALSVADRSNAVARQIGLGDDHHPRRRVVAGEYQSVVQRPAEHRDLSAGRGRSAIEHLGGHFGFTESLDDSACCAGACHHDRRATARAHVCPEADEQLGQQVVGTTYLRCRLNRDFQFFTISRRQRADRPPRTAGSFGRFANMTKRPVCGGTEIDSPAVEDRRVERCSAADRCRRPRCFQEFLAGAHQIGGAGAHLLRIAQKDVRPYRKDIGK
jgi:hypothetical protein